MGKLLLNVNVDNESLFGKIAELEESAEKMCRTARELKQHFSFQEEKAAESVENPDAVEEKAKITKTECITTLRLEGEAEYMEKLKTVKNAVSDLRKELEQLNESMEGNRKLLTGLL